MRIERSLSGNPGSTGEYVLYWALANRRIESNRALAFAAELANQRGLPLLIYEALTCSHPCANDRFHTFILEGVPENQRRAEALGAGYVFYLRKSRRDEDEVLYKLASKAMAVVTDEYPAYIPREYNASVPAKIGVPYYPVDASCIVPMDAIGKQEYGAHTIRPKIHRLLDDHLKPVPRVRLKTKFTARRPALHTSVTPDNIAKLVAASEIDHSVPPSKEFAGGRREAERRLRFFLKENLRRYAKFSREPSERATSQLSPYLHFGHISALEIALAVREYATEHKIIADEFLEELIVRRELAFNFARYGPKPDSLDALPEWARKTLAKHARDERPVVYSREQFETASTYDPLWNATQKELLRNGVIHGYYRMYWGKKIIEWSRTHQDALDTMIYLHDRYAIDGRDPNTYTNILWCFGLHDRPWTERPIFGMIRYMSLDGMRRKTDVDAYIAAQEDAR